MSDRKIAVAPEEVETIVADWVTAKVMCDPKLTGGNISAVSLYFEPGQGHARHNHPTTEQLIFVVSGEGEMMIEHEEGKPITQKIGPGSLVHIPKGAYHSTFCAGWEPIRILAVYAPPGPEAAMHDSPDFKILPPGELPKRF